MFHTKLSRLAVALQLVVAHAAPELPAVPSVLALRSVSQSEAELLIYGPIGDIFWDGVLVKDVIDQLAAMQVDTVRVRINSIGGVAADGVAIHNALERHPAKIVVVVDGQAASIASLIAMAGDEVVMPPNTLMMLHAPLLMGGGNATQLRDFADRLDKTAAAMAESYIAKTGKRSEIEAMLADGKDHWFTAAEAIAFGLADRSDETVTEPDIKAACAAMVGYLSSVAHAPAPVAAGLRGHIQAAAKPHVFASLPEVTQRAVVAQIEDPMTKQHLLTILAQGGGAPAVPVAPPVPAAPAAPAVAQPAAVDSTAAVAAALAALQARNTEIRALAEPHMVNADVRAYVDGVVAAADPTVTPAEAGRQILALLAKGVSPAAPAGTTVQAGADQRDKLVAAGTTAIMARAAVQGEGGKVIVADGSNPFRGLTLMDMARASLARAGVRTEGMDPRAVVAAAFTNSTSDFPVILENALHKTLLTAYQAAPDTWSRFCAVGSVSDFRAHNRYRVGSIGNLDALTELGEFKNKSIPDGEKASITAGTKGNIINISRQAIINDDLGAFIGLAVALGRAGRRTIESYVYALLALNGGLGPVMADGLTLFHADHGNLADAGAAVSVEAFDAGRVAMASQKDVGGNDFLNLTPAIWLGPMALGGTARVINGSEYDPDAANKLQRANKVKGLVRDVVDTPRMAGNGWHLFADPNEAAVIEVAFLNGDQNPYLESEEGFDVDGSRFKARLDFGVAAIDYRGAYRNPGA